MKFEVRSFLKDYKIRTKEHGKNWQSGWIQIMCPFCGDHNFHGGFKISTGSYNCWRCRDHETVEVISALLRISIRDSRDILFRYLVNDDIDRAIDRTGHSKVGRGDTKKRPAFVDWPRFTTELKEGHKNYLIKRGFDPDEIIKLWGIKGTGIHGDYKYRIIAPIIFNSQMVSYQGRDITDKQYERYKACKSELEVIPHKQVLYGMDYASKTAIIVEGITDVWKIGPGAIGTFGTSYTIEQVVLISKSITHAILLYDSGTDAQMQQEKLAFDLSALGTKVTELHLEDGDPAELEYSDIKYLRNKYLKN
jgi:hypothetical protein